VASLDDTVVCGPAAAGCVTRTNATADAQSGTTAGREARQDHAEVRPATFYLNPPGQQRVLQGNSAPRQQAAGQIPPKRKGHLNQAPG
jgi:hypothetical protein